MSIKGEFIQKAAEAAAYMQERTARLREEYLTAQKIASDKKAELDLASSAVKRAADFQVTLGADYQCPFCWIESGERTPLRPVSSDTGDDIFRCRHGHEHTISY